MNSRFYLGRFDPVTVDFDHVVPAAQQHVVSGRITPGQVARVVDALDEGFFCFLRQVQVAADVGVLEAQLASPHYDKYEKLAPEYDLRLARQNRVGRKANDLTYTTADARRHTLYGIKSRYTLLYINNPGCPMCRDITEALRHSSIITSKRASGELTILCLYPDEDLEAWRKEITSMPDTWIHSYDHGCVIRRMQSYDLRAIPSMYLLDAEKKVLLKDCTDVGLIERVIGR